MPTWLNASSTAANRVLTGRTTPTGRITSFIAALNDTCGVCLQYHTKIGYRWPIPIHHGCQCIQRRVNPGERALLPFCDFRVLLDAMDQSQQDAALGDENRQLLRAGLATWEDIVTRNLVREFHEVMDQKCLTVDQMVARGVDRVIAERAWALVHTPNREEADQRQRAAIKGLIAAGADPEDLVGAVSPVGRACRNTATDEEETEEKKPIDSEPSAEEIRAWKHSTQSDTYLLELNKERVRMALGPEEAGLVTVRIERDADGKPSAHFSCPELLQEKLRQYILAVQANADR
jgi:hypothetical protein